jgi:HTH-type transcriptional regulator/antitoxin HigA
METALLALEDRTKLSREEEELAELIAILIEKYEDEHHPVEGLSTPVDRLKALMEDRGVSQADLSRVLGSRSQSSEILSGVRSISKAQAKALSAHFRVPADMFI